MDWTWTVHQLNNTLYFHWKALTLVQVVRVTPHKGVCV